MDFHWLVQYPGKLKWFRKPDKFHSNCSSGRIQSEEVWNNRVKKLNSWFMTWNEENDRLQLENWWKYFVNITEVF